MYYTETKETIDFEPVLPGYYVVKDRPNMGAILTDEGTVVVDTLLKKSLARQVYGAIREVSQLPIRYLVYTHGHFDHVNAASEYMEADTRVVANEAVAHNFDQYRALRHHYQRVSEIQFNGQEGAGIDFDFVYPTMPVHERLEFEIGGKTICVVNNDGETDDHCYIYVPQDKVIFVGDQCTCSFPNIGTPFRPNRDESKWKRSLQDMMALDVEVMVPGHRDVVFGKQAIREALQAMIDVLDYLNESVSRAIDRGLSLEQTLKEVTLTPELANNPCIPQAYGCLDFAVRGIYRRLTGWFDFNPANLEGVDEREFLQAIFQMLPNGTMVLDQARRCLDGNNPRLAIRLLDMYEKAGFQHASLPELKREAIALLAQNAPNRLQQNIYSYYEEGTGAGR